MVGGREEVVRLGGGAERSKRGVWNVFQISSSGLVHGNEPLERKVALTLVRPEFRCTLINF